MVKQNTNSTKSAIQPSRSGSLQSQMAVSNVSSNEHNVTTKTSINKDNLYNNQDSLSASNDFKPYTAPKNVPLAVNCSWLKDKMKLKILTDFLLQ